jgi:TRAP transporter T-component
VLALALATTVLLAAAPGRPDTYGAEMRAGEADFAGREDAARLSSAIGHFRAAAEAKPADPAASLALARAYAFQAQAMPDTARDSWREASRAAELALRSSSPAFADAVDRGEDPGRAAAKVERAGAAPLYWLALSTMGMAQARGIVAVLAVKDGARALMERAAALDERVDFAGPRRALGAWLATLPSAAGGGASAARSQFERARALSPEYQLTRVREAEALAVLLQDEKRFEAALGEVLAFDGARAPAIGPENRLAKKLARELLARKERLF